LGPFFFGGPLRNPQITAKKKKRPKPGKKTFWVFGLISKIFQVFFFHWGAWVVFFFQTFGILGKGFKRFFLGPNINFFGGGNFFFFFFPLRDFKTDSRPGGKINFSADKGF